jgi:sec-independent protein translocase protein TatA
VVGDILQPTHLLFILVVALLVLGPKRLPEVGKSLGRGLRDFRNAVSGEDHDQHHEVGAPTSAPTEDPATEDRTLAEDPAPEPVGTQSASEPTPKPIERLG